MAKRRKVMADAASAEVAELRRQFNGLLLMLENLASSVDAGTITADEAFTVLALNLAAGSDANQDNVDSGTNDYVGTNVEVMGVKVINPVAVSRSLSVGTEEFSAANKDL